MSNATNPKSPDDQNDPPLNSPRNLVKVAFCVLLYSVVQCCNNSFNGIVDWTKMPDMSTVHTVLQQIKPAAALGTIRGVMLALMSVIIVWVGPPLWGIIGPVLGSAARGSLRFVGAFARAARQHGPFDPKDPFGMHGDGSTGNDSGKSA
ncbi:MAG: hypothetical protein EKK48_13325 [Candidatus Melainabacteria bacterium]|nr:MAG: hypothetical protein EKK48_13325 [Candidatus Melainabacteria bacterium]